MREARSQGRPAAIFGWRRRTCRSPCCGVDVSPGDYVIGDADGIAIVPSDRQAEIFAKAAELREEKNALLPLIARYRSYTRAVEVHRAQKKRPSLIPVAIARMIPAMFIHAASAILAIAAQAAMPDVDRPQPPPAAQTAGERYKSVRELTDMPAAQMIPTMAFISNSLGVTCLHCHTDVYESDEKPMKQKAREMIRMMRTVNDAQFGGKRVVTCQTCHNGRAVPAAIPSIENAGWNKPPRAVEGALPEAAEVLRRYAAAVGVDALERLQRQRIAGTVTRNNGRTPPASDAFELTQEKPRSFRLSTPLSHPPEADVELPMTFLRPPLLATTYLDLRIVARETIGGDTVIVATGTSARGVHRLYFSDVSGLLVRRSDDIETPLGAVPERYDFSDFRRVDGALVPGRIVWSRADYQVTFAITEIVHDVPAR